MKGTHLGEFEEIVMLVIAALQQDAYGLAIKKELEEQTQRKVTISAVHAACNRLEDKGFLSSSFGEKSEKRGGKRKKIYKVSIKGQEALQLANEIRQRLWSRINPGYFQIS
ncbi:MAG: helix-turn-helix transcriptional regulator [Bacteroidota bacterium]